MPATTTDINGDDCNTSEKITSKLDENFKMNGLILNDLDMLEHMDRTGKQIKLPRKTEEGAFSDNIASKEQFNCIFKHIDDTIRSMGQELFDGNISAKPLKGIKDGCGYCPYNSVCCFETGDKCNYKNALKPKEVYEKLGLEDNSNEQC
jgi:ATP-dependent helicase/nuclease subunit B